MINYNQQQEYVINKAVRHIRYGYDQVYQFGGKPGTGKTEVIKEIIRRVGIPPKRVAVMTYIGQAAIVLRSRGLYNAKTVHSTLYEIKKGLKTDKFGIPVYNSTYNSSQLEYQFKPKELEGIDYMIIDEGRTVPLKLKKEIEKRGKKIIVCGDWRQLPPVKDEPAYLRDEDIGKIDVLVEPVRQKKGSNILKLADAVYDNQDIPYGYYGDVLVIDWEDLTDEMLTKSDLILCGTNRTRDVIINRIRRDIYGIKSKLPVMGEKLICRKNDWGTTINGISLANGLVGNVINNIDVSKFDGKSFYMDFKPYLSKSCFLNVECDYEYFISDYEKRRRLKNSRYNFGQKFEFAYAISTHLAKGSQAKSGIYIEEHDSFPDKSILHNIDYTGVTRFSNRLIYVKTRRKKYF